LRIADDLDLNTVTARAATKRPPRYWPDDSKFRLFINHISTDKKNATRLRECLKQYYISGFVAHEDIAPTDLWQVEIERALHSMDAFLAFLTPGFSKSFWAQQEIGFAVARGVYIISFQMGENPTGFISKQQALPRGDKKAEEIAKEVNSLLLSDDLTAARDSVKSLTLIIRQPSTMIFLFEGPDAAPITSFAPWNLPRRSLLDAPHRPQLRCSGF
jgi:hypothetical protein